MYVKLSKRLLQTLILCSLASLLAENLLAQIVQSGNGPCPINIANVSGTVHVESMGCFDERILRPLLDTINRQDRDFRDKAREVDGWIKRYYELAERLGVPGAFSKLREEARAQFQANDLQGATKTKQQIIEQEEAQVDQIAADYYDLAELLVLQLKPLDAQSFYAKAFRYRPEIPLYAEAYARSLCDADQRAKAVDVYEMSIKELRELSKSEPAKYAPNLACTLADLTGLFYTGGDYKRAYAASQEGLQIAQSITPRDGPVAQEHVADALVGLGISLAKLGDPKNAKEKLLNAENIYNNYGITNFNRPLISEGLAEIAMQEANREEELHERERTFDLNKDLVPQAPYSRRNRLADSAYQLYQYHLRLGDFTGAISVFQDLAAFASVPLGTDQISPLFLSTVAKTIQSDLLIQTGKFDEAEMAIGESIDAFNTIEDQLRPKEKAWISTAYDTKGWVELNKQRYKTALEAFDKAVSLSESIGDAILQRATRDRRLAQFFIVEFSTAAKDFLLHADDLHEIDSAIWNYFVERRVDPSAKINIVPSFADQFDRLIISVNSGAMPRSSLTLASKIAEAETDRQTRCKRHFYVGESMLLLGDKNGGLNELKSCPPPRTYDLYPWLMRAETIKWSISSNQ